MNNKFLLLIIPFCLIIGMVFFAIIDNEAERSFMPLVETCVAYETNMDFAIILIQSHCLMDLISTQRNLLFCDEFQNQSKILSLYNWSNQLEKRGKK